jgi:LemA protein
MGGRKASRAAPWIILAVELVLLWMVAAWVRVEGSTYPKVVLLAGTVAWLVTAVRLRARQWRIDDVPSSECANVPVGFAEVSGTARLDPPLAARGSATPCAYFKWELQEHRRSGKSSRWVTVESEERRPPFRVVDRTGEVWVDPEHAELIGVDEHVAKVPGRSGKWRQVEWRIDIDEPVYVIGPTRVRADAALAEFGTDESSDEFIVSDDTERKVRNRISFAAWSSAVLGAVAAGLAFIVRAEPTFDSDGDPAVAYHFVDSWARVWSFAVVAVAVFVGVLAFSWVFRAYNRLVRVRGQAEKAWSLIAVELQRRHDLLGQLIAVVREHARYESEVQVGLVRTRSGLPDSPELAAAGHADLGARVQAGELVALAEAYPALRATDQFAALQQAITTSEDRVAAARRFYNDAVTVARDRRSTFPSVVVAAWVEWPSLDLFEAEADEQGPVALGST